jgi:TfoX/Sxy family transcriptional regulator of competence genes
MKNTDYRGQLNKVLGLVSPTFPEIGRLEFKNCFGAIAGYINGNIFISCGKFGVALKLPQDVLMHLFKEPGVAHLKYFAKGHVKKDYAVIPPHILSDQSRLRDLLERSIKYALSGAP